MKYPRLQNAFFDINSEIFPQALWSWIYANNTAVVVAVKRVLTLQPTGHSFSYPAGFWGACTLPQYFEVLSFALAALVVAVARIRPARAL